MSSLCGGCIDIVACANCLAVACLRLKECNSISQALPRCIGIVIVVGSES